MEIQKIISYRFEVSVLVPKLADLGLVIETLILKTWNLSDLIGQTTIFKYWNLLDLIGYKYVSPEGEMINIFIFFR